MRITANKSILHNNVTNCTFIASELDEQVQTGTRENDSHIEWMGNLNIPAYPQSHIANLEAEKADLERLSQSDQKHITSIEKQNSQYIKLIDRFVKSPKNGMLGKISNLEAQNKELREALGVYDTWPVTDVLLKLIESTEYLLDVKNYDRHGWEEVSHCTKVGREMVLKIQQALKEDKQDG